MIRRSAPIAALLAVGVAAGCGAPSHQLVSPIDTDFTYEVPSDLTSIAGPDDPPGQVLLGTEGADPDGSLKDPVMLVARGESGELHSYESLRRLAFVNQFDPLDDMSEVPEGLQVINYLEINETDAWGVRLLVFLDDIGYDMQLLVDRQSDHVAYTRIYCTQACFIENLTLIDDIQNSWSLEN